MSRTGRDNNASKISKRMSFALRHGAEELKLTMRPDGYVRLNDLLRAKGFRGTSESLIYDIVRNCPKQRFQILEDSGVTYIRANQGHTINSVQDSLLLEPITPTNIRDISIAYHGTYRNSVAAILATGLSRMRRNHIHLTPRTETGVDGVISGMRGNADTIICVDIAGALAAGIPFYRSSNNVILTPGMGENGCIPAKFIRNVIDRATGQELRGWRDQYQDMTGGLKREWEPFSSAEVPPSAEGSDEMSRGSSVQSLPAPPMATTIKGKSNDGNTTAASGSHYYCVIDFEATCMQEEQISPQEIIEFPAVFVNASTLCIEMEFHAYVRPVHHPLLTLFCTELTGITQETVDQAAPFPTVLDQFADFLISHGFSGGGVSSTPGVSPAKTFTVVTCGDWDLKTMLPAQMDSLQPPMPVPPYLRQWVNVKRVFNRVFPPAHKKKRIGGMVAMLNALNIELVGRHHSGIDDSRNIANVLIALCARGGRVDYEDDC